MGASQHQPQLDLGRQFEPSLDRRPERPVGGSRLRPVAGGVGVRASPEPVVEVRRSTRRRRTVSAYRDGDRTIVLIPARMSRAEEREWVAVMLRRLDAQDRRKRPSDAGLLARASQLSADHLGAAARPSSVRWVTNQASRWGSCTPSDGTIRLSHRLQGMPSWVIDYVLVHELAHLIEATHSPRFWSLVGAYPRAERARGYLEGISAAVGRAAPEENGGEPSRLDGESCLDPDSAPESGRIVDGIVTPTDR